MCEKYAFFNRKGGVGKSTLCSNIAYAYSKIGKKVLVIDLDSQKDCSFFLGIQKEEDKQGKKPFDLIFTEKDPEFEEYIVEVRANLFVMLNENLKTVENYLGTISRIDKIFATKLQELEKKFDMIFIDCSPSISKVNDATLCYIDGIILPVQLEAAAIKAVANIYDYLGDLYLEPSLLKVVIPNMLKNTKDSRENLKILQNLFEKDIVTDPIPVKAKITEAGKYGRTVFEYDGATAQHIMNVFKKVVTLLG